MGQIFWPLPPPHPSVSSWVVRALILKIQPLNPSTTFFGFVSVSVYTVYILYMFADNVQENKTLPNAADFYRRSLFGSYLFFVVYVIWIYLKSSTGTGYSFQFLKPDELGITLQNSNLREQSRAILSVETKNSEYESMRM